MKIQRLLFSCFLFCGLWLGVFAEETFKFDASVNKLMNIIINSLYKSKDVFLRELISNASDALDKIRFLSLAGKEDLGANKILNITIEIVKDKNQIIITDSGIGMTRQDLKNNLGTIARSGTAEFLSKLESGESASNLIGKFGVGFYSAFLVADKVQVVSKNNHDEQLIWMSTNQDDYSISSDSNGNTLLRGTRIILDLKEDAKEFLDKKKLRDLIQAHSQYIQFPIYLWDSKMVEQEVQQEEGDVVEVEDDEDGEEKKPKTIKKEVFDWDLINKQKPIWIRNPADVTEEEYNAFYKSFSNDLEDPITYSHLRAEGDVEFSTLLYIPKILKDDPTTAYTKVIKNLKLYVRRVFITDDLTDLLPRFLSFITGIIDADDLPLNVSRETLQKNSHLKVIKKKILGKVLEMIKNLMNDEEKYLTFYEEYEKNIKLGILDNQTPEKTIEKLITFLRFHSSKTGKMISLHDYVMGMPETQPQIYYVLGESVKEIESMPYLESIIAKGYEVLYLTGALDIYLTQMKGFKIFNNVTLQNIAKSGVDLGGDDKAKYQQLKVKFQPLLDRLKRTLSVYIKEAKVSRQLATSPCAVIAPDQALDSAGEKILKAQQQAKKNPAFDYYMRQKYTFEINPNHPIIIELLNKAEDNSDAIEDTIHVLFESTMISSGYSIRNPRKFGIKIQTVIKKSLGIAAVLDEDYNAGYADGTEKEEKKEDDFPKEEMDDMLDDFARTHKLGTQPKKESDPVPPGEAEKESVQVPPGESVQVPPGEPEKESDDDQDSHQDL